MLKSARLDMAFKDVGHIMEFTSIYTMSRCISAVISSDSYGHNYMKVSKT